MTLVSAAVAAIALSSVDAAWAEPVANGLSFAVVPGMIAGSSPDTLGTWRVHYQRVNGGNADVAAAINDGIDAEANREVQENTWDASTRRPWTFDATGTAFVRPITVSELFVGQYNTAEPHMPMQTVATVVFDSRSGIPITWDNLFLDRSAGLTRLSEQSSAILPTVYPPPHAGDWERKGGLAPTPINFKYWIPTAEGIELHFPDTLFGRGLKVITVPWAKVADLIAPEFLSIMA
ncbi:DUF3298 domain-containing protein [Mycobacterium intracellulare]|uniref:DUF3298 domain-containing protein n=1 Tax=Mycobacterium intracellulare TaxID=1767 RepID=UPI001EED2325|nr:DUF3298 domain-containing protein [Mycobacterium intracellulare]MEE3753133.1 DUF3298 domain-containing protein [Mycobacterium intracellulare]